VNGCGAHITGDCVDDWWHECALDDYHDGPHICHCGDTWTEPDPDDHD